ELFDALAPLVRDQGRGIHLVGGIRRPEEGGILGPDELGVPALLACLPFLREGRVVDFMRDAGEWYGQYSDRIPALCPPSHPVRVRCVLPTSIVGGSHAGAPGRKPLLVGPYAPSSQATPPGPQYVALGHIHAPQPIPGSPVPGQYAGSLLPLDFGEAGERKR